MLCAGLVQMTESKLNCWQYMRCGREPGGANAASQGVCPAATDRSYDGIHSGQCAGRFCWAVSGTFCGGVVQGTFARKRDLCTRCHFYQRVQAEEGTANLRTKFLRFVQPGGSLLKGLEYRHIPKGTRFLHQGEEGRAGYIIQRGACMKLVEKEGCLHPASHFNEGDVVGFIALLTGEPQSGHVEAETDMEVWVVDRRRLDDLSSKDRDLMSFLTEIVADRFDSRRPIAKRTIGPCVADDIVGRGGFSIVYKGTCSNTRGPVAIKMLRHHLALDPDFLSNFHREARIISTLRHDHIIQVYDILERFRTVFILMEYLEGETVKDLLARRKRLPAADALDLLRQACEATAHAHDRGLIHRDLNPSNMMVLPHGRLKLIDFGLACPTGTEDMEQGGNLAYQAPELIEGDPADQRSDVFALGITAYEMICGEIPHGGKDIRKFMLRRKNEPVPDPRTRGVNIPAALLRFIVKACRKDPGARYADARQALADLTRQTVRQG